MTIRQSVFRIVIPVSCFLLAACGSDGPMQGEDYGNLLNSPEGLVVVEEEHPTGWGRPDCFACHEARNIHVVNRTGVPDCVEEGDDSPDEACIDLAEIRAFVQSEREASCPACHGSNGVNP